MKVIRIEKLERGKHRITTDNELIFYLYFKEIKGLAIVVDESLTEQQWEKIVEILTVRGKKRVYHLLARQDYTTKKLKDKLRKDGYPDKILESIVNYFLEKGFVDDYAYTEKFYNSYKKSKGRRVIEGKLLEKGISQEIVKTFFESLNEPNTEAETALRLLEKKFGRYAKDDLDYQKMVRFLAYRGFSYELCRQAIADFRCE